jgi:hypothetical protein
VERNLRAFAAAALWDTSTDRRRKRNARARVATLSPDDLPVLAKTDIDESIAAEQAR